MVRRQILNDYIGYDNELSAEELQWLDRIDEDEKSDLDDELAGFAFADWLEERGDARAEWVRECSTNHFISCCFPCDGCGDFCHWRHFSDDGISHGPHHYRLCSTCCLPLRAEYHDDYAESENKDEFFERYLDWFHSLPECPTIDSGAGQD